MKKRRVVITGGSGLLALNWACAMRNDWDIILGTHRHSVCLAHTSSFQLDLDDQAHLEQQFDQLAPDLVVHTAGLTSVDRCEENSKLARHVNTEIARNVAYAAVNRNIPLIHISTDHLYTGKRSFYSESDPPQPLNEYGLTKALAEKLVLETHPAALIVRTNFFGWGHAHRQSFSDWLIYGLRGGSVLTLFDDVYFTPILADTLALACHQLADQGVSGIVNIAGDERLSKYEFALQLAKHFTLPLELIRRDQIAHANLRAQRPADMSLDNTKARNMLGKKLGCLDEYLAALRSQEEHGRRLELLHAVSP